MRRRWTRQGRRAGGRRPARRARRHRAAARGRRRHDAGGLRAASRFDGVWTGAEAKSFGAVITAFNKQYPGVKVNYKPVGDNLPTVVSTAVAGGNPPDMADIAQPGLVKQFVDKGALKPITYARKAMLGELRARRGSRSAPSTGSSTGSSSRRATSRRSGTTPTRSRTPASRRRRPGRSSRRPRTRSRPRASPAYSIGGADGWTLTDLFENIYLRQAGAGEVRRCSRRTRSSGPTRRSPRR